MRYAILHALMPLLLAAAPAEDRGVPFNPRNDPGFGDATAALKLFLAGAVPRPRSPQHFCIIGYRVGRERLAWVHWDEGRALILWSGRGNPDYPADEAIARSNRQIDLAQDVVPTDADIGGSTYRISRPWLDRTLADCRTHGARHVVSAPPRRREGGE